MADTKRTTGSGGTGGGERPDKGFGDEGGTRVGPPDPAEGGLESRPRGRPVPEGLEGAILQDPEGGSNRSNTGAGSEAAEGVHSAPGRDERDRSGVERAKDAKKDAAADGDDERRSGSEPIRGRTTEHKGGYGGEGGAPRTSSDTPESST